MLDCQFDSYVREQYGIVCGTDEAGRGPLAGSVVAAAVVLPVGITIDGLDDSKKLSEKKRERGHKVSAVCNRGYRSDLLYRCCFESLTE